MKLSEFAESQGASTQDVQELLKGIRSAERLPTEGAKITDVEASQLSELLKGGGATKVADDVTLEYAMQQIRELNDRLNDALQNGGAAGESPEDGQFDPIELNRRIEMLEVASSPGRTIVGSTKGRTIEVNRGELIAYDTNLWVTPVVQGGWRKVESEGEKASFTVPRISVAMKNFSYDSATGAPYHSVNQRAYRRYLKKSGGDTVVGPRDPDTDVVVANNLAVV